VSGPRSLEGVVNTVGAGLSVLGPDLRFTWTNRTFDGWFGPSAGLACLEVFGRSREDCLDCAARRALETGAPEIEVWHTYLPDGSRRTFRNDFSRVLDPESGPSLVVLTQDITAQIDRMDEMQLVERIGRALQGVRELDELLHVILTCVTTGHALGFNRAFLFLRNRARNALDGRLAVGPASAEEAYRIWGELSEKQRSLEDALRDAGRKPTEELPLASLIRELSYPLDDPRELPVKVFHERKTALVRDARTDGRVTPEFRERFSATELVAVPLVSKGRSLGVIVADNLYNRRPIGARDLELLETFSSPAGLALENAEAFADLQESLETLKRTRRQLVDQTKLAAVGKVAAHIAHEIRNPLATIGGFAHALRSRPEGAERVGESAQIIYDEAMRLEKMLSGIMDFSRPTRPVPVRQSLNALVERVSSVVGGDLGTGVSVELELDPSTPELAFDGGQIRQVLINLVKNSAEAIRGGGRVTISTRPSGEGAELVVADTGPGVPPEVASRAFEPFFTTKTGGTGLGLAVCRQIVAEHGGEISLHSERGRGTTLRVLLPADPPAPGFAGSEPGTARGPSS
jgi:hypothetical protein